MRSHWAGLLAVLLMAVGVCAVLWSVAPIWHHQNLNDDSYITLTYAKNLARGDGFIYNHPPAALGTTTPLFTLATAGVTAGVTWLGRWMLPGLLSGFDVTDAAIVLSVLAWIGSAPLLFSILRKVGMSTLEAALPSALLLLMVRPWMFYIGMEIWPFQFLMLLAVYLWWSERPLAAGVCAGALTLTRGEGVLWAGILGCYYLWRQRDALLSFISGGMGVALAWVVYAWPTFDSVVPNTLAAKQAQALLPSGRSFLERLLVDFWGYVRSLHIELGGFDTQWLNPVWVLLPLGLLALWRWRSLTIFLVWVASYVAAYTLLDPNPYAWYVLHLTFALHLLCGVGLAWLVRASRLSRSWSQRVLPGALAVLLGIGVLSTDINFMVHDAKQFPGDERAEPYKALADWLVQHTKPTDSVAYIEVGYLGYFTDNHIIDLAGLTDPSITKQLAVHGYTWGFRHYEPDYYIHNARFDWALGELATDLQKYEEVYEIQMGNAQVPIVVLQRKPIETAVE